MFQVLVVEYVVVLLVVLWCVYFVEGDVVGLVVGVEIVDVEIVDMIVDVVVFQVDIGYIVYCIVE